MTEVLSPRSFSQGAKWPVDYHRQEVNTLIFCLSVCLSVTLLMWTHGKTVIVISFHHKKMAHFGGCGIWQICLCTCQTLHPPETFVQPWEEPTKIVTLLCVCVTYRLSATFWKARPSMCWPPATMYNSFLCLLNDNMGLWSGLHCTEQISITMWIEKHQ